MAWINDTNHAAGIIGIILGVVCVLAGFILAYYGKAPIPKWRSYPGKLLIILGIVFFGLGIYGVVQPSCQSDASDPVVDIVVNEALDTETEHVKTNWFTMSPIGNSTVDIYGDRVDGLDWTHEEQNMEETEDDSNEYGIIHIHDNKHIDRINVKQHVLNVWDVDGSVIVCTHDDVNHTIEVTFNATAKSEGDVTSIDSSGVVGSLDVSIIKSGNRYALVNNNDMLMATFIRT